MLQDQYRDLYKKINPGWEDSVSLYKKIIRANIAPQMTIMEAGCGFSDLFTEEYKTAKRVIGVDINPKFLEMNDILTEKIVADLSSIPQLQDNSVDLIISSWVLEHLRTPEKVFREFARVLKPGGKLIFLTPNALNYVVILNSVVPTSLRMWIIKQMSKNLKTDPMPTFYRANSLSKLTQLAASNGLEAEQLLLNGDPTYVAINKPFFYLGVLLEKLLDLPPLRTFKVHIIGVIKKP